MYVNYSVQDYQNTQSNAGLNFSVIGGTVWSSTPVTMDTVYDPSISMKLGNLNDTFSFKIDNINNRNKDTFRLQDKLQFNLLIDSASAVSSNWIFTGLVKAIEERTDERNNFLTIKGVSFDELVTNGLVAAVDLSNVTIFQFLYACVLNLQAYTKPNATSQFYLKWNSGNPMLKKYNPLTGNYDGDNLPAVLGGGQISYYNKTLDQLLNIFLNDQYTGDGRYYWYVNPQQELVIRKMIFSPVGSLTEGVDDIISYNMTVDTTQIYNTIVVQAGNDPNGRAISTFYQDAMLTAQYGVRPFLLKTNDANRLMEQERKMQPSKWSSVSSYPSYPYTPSWGGSCSSNSDWVTSFRNQVKIVGKISGSNFVSQHSKGMRQFVIELRPRVDFKLGDIITCTFPSYNISNFNIRIYQIDYSYDNLILTLKEEYLYAV